ncbi:MAG: phosphoglycerate kinase, partial [Sciscionella sp.]
MQTSTELIADGVTGRTILVRADLNVPLDGESITDDGRIRASVPTIRSLAAAGARVLVLAHLGRPEGKPAPQLSLAPVADRLGELLGAPVMLAKDVTGPSARAAAAALVDGSVAVLQNVRFDPRETSKQASERAQFADELVELAGPGAAFVSDGFGVLHRKQASVYELARRLPSYAGELVLAELTVLRALTGEVRRPYAVLLGGSKVSDKLAVIEALLPRVDYLLVGGGMCFTFLAAQGNEVGGSLLEPDMIETCSRLLEQAGAKLHLPVDVIVAEALAEDAKVTVVAADAIPATQKGLDIGPRTVQRFGELLAEAETIFWNGPMGVFELAPFAGGTTGVAEAIIASEAYSVLGGGDSAAAVRLLALDEQG